MLDNSQLSSYRQKTIVYTTYYQTVCNSWLYLRILSTIFIFTKTFCTTNLWTSQKMAIRPLVYCFKHTKKAVLFFVTLNVLHKKFTLTHCSTLGETNGLHSLHLKIDGRKMNFPFGGLAILSGANCFVSGRVIKRYLSKISQATKTLTVIFFPKALVTSSWVCFSDWQSKK